jgi:hypothetical protein
MTERISYGPSPVAKFSTTAMDFVTFGPDTACR